MHKQTVLPRWNGFNLLGIFVMSSPGYFKEEEFQIVSDLGFNFVRLPLNYTFWIDGDDPFAINDEKLDKVDEAVRWGERYGVHVNVAFHRGPGYSVARDRVEPFDLWRDEQGLECFALHWRTLAKRYQGYDNQKVSFNLINEPANVSPEAHGRVMRATVKAIREVDPKRLIILDGLNYGNIPCPDLGDLAADNVAQSCRAYIPGSVTHFKAGWTAHGDATEPPVWPGAVEPNGVWDTARIHQHYQGWAALAEHFKMGVHCGEGGCHNHTPHDIFLRWFDDVMDALKQANIGFALWNLAGSFGILDSARADVDYEDYRGHKLDRKLLDIMKKYS